MSACVLCGEDIARHDDVVKPGPLWPVVHLLCFVWIDDEDEASDRTTTYHASSQGEPAAEHA